MSSWLPGILISTRHSKHHRGSYELQLLNQVIQAGRRRADETMLPRNQAQQRRQLQIAQIMDLVDEAFIRHRIGQRSPSGPLATFLLQQTEFRDAAD